MLEFFVDPTVGYAGGPRSSDRTVATGRDFGRTTVSVSFRTAHRGDANRRQNNPSIELRENVGTGHRRMDLASNWTASHNDNRSRLLLATLSHS